jgi:hypothetical protein
MKAFKARLFAVVSTKDRESTLTRSCIDIAGAILVTTSGETVLQHVRIAWFSFDLTEATLKRSTVTSTEPCIAVTNPSTVATIGRIKFLS